MEWNMMASVWPQDFEPVPAKEWTTQDPGDLARKYDTVESHGWYSNLEPTVEELAGALGPGDVLLDYSGGTGIFADRLLRRMGDRSCGVLVVDSSPKFLRLALAKLHTDPRVAYRLIRYVKAERRLERLDEVLSAGLLERGVDAITSTNAIHLYYGLDETLTSWFQLLRPGGACFVQSGNIANPENRREEWIIDETVHAIHAAAIAITRRDDRYAAYRDVLDDAERMAAHDRLRNKYFLPVRPLSFYLDALGAAGFDEVSARSQRIDARVVDWYAFISAYHEGVLGWVGGSRRIEGREPSEEAVHDRLALIREAMSEIFPGQAAFPCRWTYITAKRS